MNFCNKFRRIFKKYLKLIKKYILEIYDNYIDFIECFVNKKIIFIRIK